MQSHSLNCSKRRWVRMSASCGRSASYDGTIGDDEQTFGVKQQVPHAGAVYKENGDGSAALFTSRIGQVARCRDGARAAVSTALWRRDTGFR